MAKRRRVMKKQLAEAHIKKPALKSIYALIFVLSLVLSLASVIEYIVSVLKNKWVSFVLAIMIMFLSIWGYVLVDRIYRR